MLLAALLLAVRLGSPQSSDVPLKQPQIAAQGETVALTYGAGNSVYFAVSHDGAKTFGDPVKVADSSFLALGRHRGPRIVMTKNSIVISAIVGRKGRGVDGDLIAWLSTDGGKSWSKGMKLNDQPDAAREGLHGMAANKEGVIFATWLDLRSKATQLYGTVSKDGGLTWSSNRLIYASPDGHICECCHPSSAVGPDGTLYAMLRNWLGGSRDMYLGVSRDGGANFQASKLGQGTWPMNACPMDGGGLAFDAQGTPVTLWRRADTVFTAAQGKHENPLGKGKDGAIAADSRGRIYAGWSSGGGIMIQSPGRPDPTPLHPNGAFVHLAGTGPVYAAWETGNTIMVEKLPE